jgi:hypothetical protein
MDQPKLPPQLTPRQLLLLLFTACVDAGYDVLTRRQILKALYKARRIESAPVQKPSFCLSGLKAYVREVDSTLHELQQDGLLAFDAEANAFVINASASDAEVYKDLHDGERQVLRQAMIPYIADFVRSVTRKEPDAPKARPDSHAA